MWRSSSTDSPDESCTAILLIRTGRNQHLMVMERKRAAPKSTLEDAEQLRDLALRTAEAAMTAAPGYESTVLDAAERLDKFASSRERQAKLAAAEPPVVVLPSDATVDEVRKARRRQATRRGQDVYLPSWSDMALALPNTFLRSALFSAGRHVQANNKNVLEGDLSALVADKEVVSFSNLTLTLSGYELCQFDRQVYATCLDYYRERPLSPEASNHYVKTSFYEFATRMELAYGLNPHKAIRASLLRLSFAQIRIRHKGWNLEVPKLLTVSFEDGSTSGVFKGSDLMLLRVTEPVAELFGRGAWTAVEKDAVGYDGLMGWLASFYTGHSKAKGLPVEFLQRLSGYQSHPGNFKTSLIRALDKLKDKKIPESVRVSEYYFTEDGKELTVVRAAWAKSTLPE